jgi:cytochrome c biogenesis protein CcmG/thiol:disulfide interchange protein DsbE
MTKINNTVPKRSVPMWTQVIIWGLLIVLLIIVGLGLNRAQKGTVQPGNKIPDFTLLLFKGYEYEGSSEIKISDLRGRVVVLNFWASWCKPCEQEAAELQQVWNANKASGEVIFLGVDYVDTEPQARVYLEKYEIDFYNGPDMGTEISQLFRMKGVPETYFIDREGVLQYVKVGPFASAKEIQSYIDELLK